ncbi:MAG: DUF6174 domain-containing protein [Treponema sp.]|jgi:hypothetical protein|nr:DUF6174 domain-containing protein [Treponema sp.]
MGGCDNWPAASERKLFYQEKAAWEAQDIKAYRFTARTRLNIPTRPVTITVTEGTEPVIESEHDHFDVLYGKTILDIYTGIEDTVREEKQSYAEAGYSLKFNVRYNDQYHYPEFIW